MGIDAKDGNGIKRRLLKHSEVKHYRKKIKESQNNKCLICERDFTDTIQPTLDHDHETYLVRGVLCRSCNAIEGKIKGMMRRYGLKDIKMSEFLRNMAYYIEKEQYPYIHPMHKPKTKKLMKSSYNDLVREVRKYNETAAKPIKIPDYPKSGRLLKSLEKLYKKFGIIPKFYK